MGAFLGLSNRSRANNALLYHTGTRALPGLSGLSWETRLVRLFVALLFAWPCLAVTPSQHGRHWSDAGVKQKKGP